MKPHSSLRKQLVHPKDKIDPLEKTDCIYEIPCKNYAYSYIGETGRKFTTCLKEHKKEVEKLESKNKNFTRQTRKQSVGEQNKSAIADHALQNNHVIILGWCKSPSNGERCKCPVHTRIHLDQEKRIQRHEPWWGGLLFKSCLWPSSDVTWRPQNRKSDAEEEITLKKSVAHDGRNCQVSVNFNPGFVWKKVYFNLNI